MRKLRFIAYLHYRYNWPLFIPELLTVIPEEWKLDKCCALYHPKWSWINAQHNRKLRQRVADLVSQL